MSKVLKALGKMDPMNDNHWTSDGMPRIDTVKFLAGDPTLTREMVTAEAPDFTRQALLAMQATAGATPPSRPHGNRFRRGCCRCWALPFRCQSKPRIPSFLSR